MTALLLASPAWAEKVVYTDSATKLIFLLDTETRTARIQGYSATPKGALTLPTEVTYQETTYAVDGVLESAFQGLARVTSLTAGENIKYIGPSAFKSCGMLRSATLKGVEVIERTGTSVDEIALAAQALVSDGVQAVFTPTDNTVMKSELTIYETFAEAGIPHYTGADSFALNGAFLGYGVDYANLGAETANMIASILLDGADPAATAVKTFDNGTATINTEICEQLGIDFDELSETFAPYCTKVQSIVTAESFDEVQ